MRYCVDDTNEQNAIAPIVGPQENAMDVIEHKITLQFRHRLYFTDDAFAEGSDVLEEAMDRPPPRARVLAVIDADVALAHPRLAARLQEKLADRLVGQPLRVAGGEQAKNSDRVVEEVYDAIDRYHIDRHSYVLCIGGGAVLDAVGFAAATAHRGIRLLRMPTTTLSQDDSGVGVKNGINRYHKKNFIGTFAVPYAVINDFSLLATQPEDERRAGLVEAVKVALIKDAAFFEEIERGVEGLAAFEPGIMRRVIRRSAELHMEHIATGGDPFEFGSSRPLDFGHWAAHKIEQLTDFAVSHGCAVAIGIALDTIYSHLTGLLAKSDMERVLALLVRLRMSLYDPVLTEEDGSGRLLLAAGLDEFREHLGGELTVMLLEGIGSGVDAHSMDAGKINQAIGILRERYAAEPSAH